MALPLPSSGQSWRGGDWQVLIALDDGPSESAALEEMILRCLFPPPIDATAEELAALRMEHELTWRAKIKKEVLEHLKEVEVDIVAEAVAQALSDQAVLAIVATGDASYRLMHAVDRRTEDPALRGMLEQMDEWWNNCLADLADPLGRGLYYDSWPVYMPLGDSELLQFRRLTELSSPTRGGDAARPVVRA